MRTLGDLDRNVAWNRVFGMVNSAPGFNRRPFDIPVEIEAEVQA